MPDYLNLKGFNNIFEATVNNELQDNLVEFLDWGLLEKGNYFNILKDQKSIRNQDYSKLNISTNSNFAPGKAWDGFRKNWVWQSGISYSPSPFVSLDSSYPGVSGVYVNDIFYPTNTTGEFAHKIDHFNGRVVFDTPIPTGSKVQASFSYKYINTIYADNVPFIRELQRNTLDRTNSSTVVLPAEMRVQLPAIAIEVIPRRTLKGFQLGGGQWIYTDVIFHCIAEDAYTRNKLIDLISLQNNKTIITFNSNAIAEDRKLPRNSYGFLNPGAMRYPDMIENYPEFKLTFTNTIVQNMDTINTNFYAGIVRTTTEIIKTSI